MILANQIEESDSILSFESQRYRSKVTQDLDAEVWLDGHQGSRNFLMLIDGHESDAEGSTRKRWKQRMQWFKRRPVGMSTGVRTHCSGKFPPTLPYTTALSRTNLCVYSEDSVKENFALNITAEVIRVASRWLDGSGTWFSFCVQ